MKKSIFKIFALLLALNMFLFGDSGTEVVEVSLDSFGTLGIVILVGLSSLLGAFFVKDEISEAFKQ